MLYDLSTVCVLCCTDGMALAVDPTGDRIDKEEGSNFSATLVAFHSESGPSGVTVAEAPASGLSLGLRR